MIDAPAPSVPPTAVEPHPEAMEALCAALADLAYDLAVARMNEQEAKSA